MRMLYQATSRSVKTNGNKGFTLVELLVVVVIIAILASIAIPQFSKHRKQAAAAVEADARNCITDAIASITQSQMIGSPTPTGGSYNNRSPQTGSCTWTYAVATGLVSCSCIGSATGAASGVTCTAQQTTTGFTVTCTGL